MKKTIIIIMSLVLTNNFSSAAQHNDDLVAYEANEMNPFGRPNDKAPEEIKDFEKLIGICNCKSVQYRENVAGDTLDLRWRWKYILNGNAVQDDGWFGDDKNVTAFTSIRILNPQTNQWQVPFFVPFMTSEPQIWKGGKQGKDIVFRKPVSKSKDEDVESVLTFSNITKNGFDWISKRVNLNSKKEIVFWKIWCVKQM